MTTNDFIFSNQRRHRLARHILFWLVWCLVFNILFHFPIHVFKGWDTSGELSKNYQELGPVLFFMKALVINSLFAVIIPQIALVYILLYWLLPGYYYKKRNLFLVAAVTISVLILFYAVAVAFKYSPVVYNKIAGTLTSLPSLYAMQRFVIIDQVTSLPIVLGLALLIKLVKKWWHKQKETQQLANEKMKAELQLLKAQVHPHFLFNTINNIYFFTLTNSAQAPAMIRKLTGLLNYIINECDKPFVSLDKEIKMIQDYMDLEKIRYADHMQMTVEIDGNYEGKMVAPLLLIPFVENSFKHGASKMITKPWVKVIIKIENDRLHFDINNSKPGISDPASSKGNIGLKNVKKRLELLYPGAYDLNIMAEEGCYAVRLDLQLYNKEHIALSNEVKPHQEYAMA